MSTIRAEQVVQTIQCEFPSTGTGVITAADANVGRICTRRSHLNDQVTEIPAEVYATAGRNALGVILDITAEDPTKAIVGVDGVFVIEVDDTISDANVLAGIGIQSSGTRGVGQVDANGTGAVVGGFDVGTGATATHYALWSPRG